MRLQLDLFAQQFGTHPKRLVRREDPETSHEAAEKVDSTRLEEMVYLAIREFGDRGCTSDEVRAKFNLPYSSVTARYKALEEKGLIEYDGKRPGNSGRLQRVMRATR